MSFYSISLKLTKLTLKKKKKLTKITLKKKKQKYHHYQHKKQMVK